MKKKSAPKKKNVIPVRVSIIMGSDSDLPFMKPAGEALKELGVAFEMRVISAHRTPKEMVDFAENARINGLRVIIAGAGGAAHLPGMVAALTELPVIGVPVPNGIMKGQDALMSIVQMPRGVPVATVAIDGAFNAGILAAQILSADSTDTGEKLSRKVLAFKQKLRKKVLNKRI